MSSAIAPVLNIVDGHPTCLSTDVARQFGKQHRNLLRDIDRIVENLSADYLPNFEQVTTTFINGKGGTQTARAFRLTLDGFTLLAMGFTGKEALAFKVAYIKEFRRMEAELLRQREEATRAQAGPTLPPELAALLALLAPVLSGLLPHLQSFLSTWLQQRLQAVLAPKPPAYAEEPWFDILKGQAKRHGRAEVARELGVSAAQVTQVLNYSGKYGAGRASPHVLGGKVLRRYGADARPQQFELL